MISGIQIYIVNNQMLNSYVELSGSREDFIESNPVSEFLTLEEIKDESNNFTGYFFNNRNLNVFEIIQVNHINIEN